MRPVSLVFNGARCSKPALEAAELIVRRFNGAPFYLLDFGKAAFQCDWIMGPVRARKLLATLVLLEKLERMPDGTYREP